MSANHLSQRMRSSAGEVAYGAAGSGPDLVLIHGTPFSSRIWSSVIDRLSSRFRIHFLDLPGYGRSDKFEGQEVRLRSFARVLREFVEHVGLRRPHLVGHDFGAAAVLGANLIENVEVSSLTIADGVVLNPWGTDYSMLLFDVGAPKRSGLSRSAILHPPGGFSRPPEHCGGASDTCRFAGRVSYPMDRGCRAASLLSSGGSV